MSNTIQKQIFDTWLTMLKTRGHEQCRGRLRLDQTVVDVPAKKFLGFMIQRPQTHIETRWCAIGLLIEAAKIVTGKMNMSSSEASKLANIAGLGIFKEPEKVQELLKKNPDWLPGFGSLPLSVAHLNDCGMSFENIAKIVEQVPLYSVDDVYPSGDGKVIQTVGSGGSGVVNTVIQGAAIMHGTAYINYITA